MKIAFNPSTVAALTTPPNNKDITFDLRGRNIFARGVKFCGTDTNTWRDIKINNVSIGSHTLDLRNGSNTTLTNTNGVVTINSTWRPVVDNLTSDSTTSSLSAKQGKILKSLIDGKSNSGHTHDDRYVRAFGTSNDNIDSDWGQSFKTFDPIPSGTPPEQNPNISLLNIGDNFNRRKQLAFTYSSDYIYYRRHTEYGFSNWKRLALANEIPTSLKNPHALTISLNGTSQGPYDGSAAKNINITPGSIGAATSGHKHDHLRGHRLGYRHLDAGPKSSWSDSRLYIGYNGFNDDNGVTNSIGFYRSTGTGTYTRTLWAEINSNGLWASNRFGVNGQNTEYNFYVNGTSLLNNTVRIQYNTPNLYIRNTVDTSYSIIKLGTNSNENASYIFQNGPSRTNDGGANTMTIRNNVGVLRLQNRVHIDSTGRIYPEGTSSRRTGMYGVYDSFKIGHIWSIGTKYMIPDDGANFGNLYGLAYKHQNNKTGGTMAGRHQVVWCDDGHPRSAMGYNGFWAAGGYYKNGSSDSYVLLGGGGHKTISSLSVNYASSAGNADTVDGYHATDGRTFTGNINWSGNWNDVWSDGTNKHPWYGFDHRYPNTGAYSTTISDYWGMTIKTANTLRLDFGTLLLKGTSIYSINVASATKLQTPRTIWGQSFDGTGNVNGTIYINNSNSSNGAIRLNSDISSNARISAIDDQVIFNTGNAIRFGETAWDWNQWAGLKYNHSSKTIYLGIADNSIFNANRAQSGGTLNLRAGISNIDLNSGTAIRGLPTNGSPYNSAVTLNDTSIYLSAYGNISMSTGPGAIELTSGYGGIKLSCSGTNASINPEGFKVEASRGVYLNSENSGDVNLCVGGGKVGIGYSSPSYKLDVNGQMRADGFHHYYANSNNYVLLAGGGYGSLFTNTSYNYTDNSNYSLIFHKLGSIFNNLVWVDGYVYGSTSAQFIVNSNVWAYKYDNSSGLGTTYSMGGNDYISVDAVGVVLIRCNSPHRVGFFYTGKA